MYGLRQVFGATPCNDLNSILKREMLECQVGTKEIIMRRAEPVKRTPTALRRNMIRFEAALRNISEGLSMFDAARKLVICNERYASIYELPAELTKAGTPHASIVEYRIEHGMQPLGTENFLENHEVLLREGKAATVTVTLGNGRVISIRHRPIAGGGWVATHQDVTGEISREKELQLQSFRLEAALDNMTQGLCMFGSDSRLIVSNRRYAEMYKIPVERVRPGMELAELLSQRVDAGNMPVEGMNAFLAKRLDMGAENESCAFDVEMIDGRVISVRHQSMIDGGWVATHEDITEQRRQLARLKHLAGHDALTDLPNRILFQRHLEQVVTRVQRGEIIGLLYLDLDFFKLVNDTLGHAGGDAVLKKISQGLVECLGKGDFVARLGGDEFAVLTRGLDRPEDAAILAERIVAKCAEPFHIESHHIPTGVSVGIAVAPIDGEDGQALIKRADLALYRAKEEGRGTYHFYERGLDMALQNRRDTEIALRNALARGEFRLMFQPLVNLSENRVCAFEALLRWQHPERGLLGPAAFITAAEETGLITPIGLWVLDEACAVAASWPDHIGLAINLSPVQFRHNRNLVGNVTSALSAAGLAPNRLELEVTESVLLADDEGSVDILREFKKLGVKVALDDFGTGYSSLSYLRRFPFDKIKIDRSFVQDSPHNADSLAIVKAVIALGRSLGMATTAEGVETEAQLDIVRQQGCTEVQGFLFSVPLSVDGAKEYAARFNRRKPLQQDIKLAS
jgi:diguanylate cyclase (GGDEF)-like protein